MTPLVAADDRRLVTVRGQDRSSFLDAVLSQDLTTPTPGRWTQALWLDVHGAPLAAMDVLADPDRDELHLLVVAERVETVVEGLGGRTFLAQASFHPCDDPVVAVRGEGAWSADPGTVRREGELLVVGRTDGVDLIGGEAAQSAWLEEHGLGPVEPIASLLDHEVRAGTPRDGFEVVAPHLPEELGLLPTHVHLAKGCYPGQEAVARMWMLGRPRRVLVMLDVTGADGDDAEAPAEAGSEVGQGRDRWRITRVTSAAPWRALALAPAGTTVGDRLDAGRWSATVTGVVGADLPQPGADPAVTRRRDRRR